MDLLSPSTEIQGEVKTGYSLRKKDHLKYLRKFGDSVVETSRNLRSIFAEPKRLVWRALDKESFENLILGLKI